ncbi:hypothetical protein IEQ34_020165 [Dendrobium chrysotoxum]|uniref:Uncharacterized protein n=1 Tax=Dendrobium chrysotoxum TaxID=161865 RepID=A0AAV7G175_DENCH|nr:hypothetical protein IEQ34_020165 [Dendrobium chrysotoxum]
MPRIPVMPPTDGSKKPGVIFILDKAPLENGKVGNTERSRKRGANKRQNAGENSERLGRNSNFQHYALAAILNGWARSGMRARIGIGE